MLLLWLKKTVLNTTPTEVTGKIPDTTYLADRAAFNTKAAGIENKISDPKIPVLLLLPNLIDEQKTF